MAREINIGPRKFWIVSEPAEKGWKAQVLEVLDDGSGTEQMGIETTGETRSVADDRPSVNSSTVCEISPSSGPSGSFPAHC